MLVCSAPGARLHAPARVGAGRRGARVAVTARPRLAAGTRCQAAAAAVEDRAAEAGTSTSGAPENQLLVWRDEQLKAATRGLGPAVPKYNVSFLQTEVARRPFAVLERCINVGLTLGGLVGAVLLDSRLGVGEQKSRQRARELRDTLTRLGPAFVKLGQALSTRPDLLPPPYLEELEELQDALPTFPDSEAFGLIESELGVPLESVFKLISPSPIAAASLGQVYKAELLTGEIVAVKVQRPNIAKGMAVDFFLVRGLASIADRLVTSLNTSLAALVDDFAAKVFAELDYVQEGRNAERFSLLYCDRPEVMVPKVYWSAVSARVLTMEWVEGTKLSDQVALKAQGLDVLELVDIGIQCSLRQLLEHGYFHADPHPGNLLATRDGKLAFIDFGMMSDTPASARYAIIAHVVHLVNRDYEEMARDYYRLEFLDESVDVRPIVPALAAFFDDVLAASVSELNFKTITDGLGAVLYQYPFNVPAYYALILRSLTVLEGLALITDPQFKVLAKAYPYMARRLLTDPTPELRSSLIELLFKDGSFRWNRLENLLREGKKSTDYKQAAVLRSFIDIVLAEQPDGKTDPLRQLVEAESVRVVEALLLGAQAPGTAALVALLPAALQQVAPWQLGLVRPDEEARLADLRAQVLRVYQLLVDSNASASAGGGASGFNAGATQSVLAILQEPRTIRFGQRVANRVLERMAARGVQSLFRIGSGSFGDAAAPSGAAAPQPAAAASV